MSDNHWYQKVGEDGELITLSFPTLKHVMGTDWRDDARCAKLPKKVFFEYNSQEIDNNTRKCYKNLALDTCKNCPVIKQCYEFAICNNEKFGIWAGLTPDQRRPIVKRFKETGTLESLPSF